MKKILSCILLPLLLLTVLSGCGKNEEGTGEYHDSYFFGMDTYITIRLAAEDEEGNPLSEEYLEKTAGECAGLLNRIDLLLSAHNEESQVWALNQNINMMIDSTGDLRSVLDTAYTVSELTDGAYDPTLGTLSELWNIKGGGPVPEDTAIMETLLHTGTDKITIKGNNIIKTDASTKIDLGGVGKGYATQEILQYLSGTDVPYGLVSLGGNIGVFGSKENGQTYKIGVRDPDDPNGVVGYLYISSGFVSVSGDYERYFEEGGKRYHHILDPVTGYPAESGLRSVACLTTNGASADALSTALFVMGEEKALSLYGESNHLFEAVFIKDSGEVILTDGLKNNGRFELTNENYFLQPGADSENTPAA